MIVKVIIKMIIEVILKVWFPVMGRCTVQPPGFHVIPDEDLHPNPEVTDGLIQV